MDDIEKYSNISNNLDYFKILYEVLMSDDVVKSIRHHLSNLLVLIPEIEPMVGFDHKHPHHHLDVWEHTLFALSLSKKDFDIRLTLLLHDIGKPFSYTEKEGVRHFHGHPEVSSKMSRDILNRLGFKSDYVEKICYLVKYHDTPIKETEVYKNHELVYLRFLIQRCDALAHNPDKLEKREKYLAKTKILFLEQ